MQVFQSEVAVSRVEKCEKSIVVVGGKTFNLTEKDGKVDAKKINEPTLNQEQTNTNIILYLKYAAQKGFRSSVVRTPDTDIFFILLADAASIRIVIFLHTCSGKQRQLINLSEIAR